jgi:hypothetical protein
VGHATQLKQCALADATACTAAVVRNGFNIECMSFFASIVGVSRQLQVSCSKFGKPEAYRQS